MLTKKTSGHKCRTQKMALATQRKEMGKRTCRKAARSKGCVGGRDGGRAGECAGWKQGNC